VKLSTPRGEWIPTQRVLSPVQGHEMSVVRYLRDVEGPLYSWMYDRGLDRLEV
jgi:hypothetical protein